MTRMLIAALIIAGAAPVQAGGFGERTDRGTEQRLRHRLSAEPNDQVMMARLARHYDAAGRAKRAARLYRGLLTLENVTLETRAGNVVSSHGLANAALGGSAADRPVRLGAR